MAKEEMTPAQDLYVKRGLQLAMVVIGFLLTWAFNNWAQTLEEMQQTVREGFLLIKQDIKENRRKIDALDDELDHHKVNGANRRSVLNGRISRIEAEVGIRRDTDD